ncbi:MAG: hypothetical protein EOP04_03900, partial [Proteobacteria bacterium]
MTRKAWVLGVLGLAIASLLVLVPKFSSSRSPAPSMGGMETEATREENFEQKFEESNHAALESLGAAIGPSNGTHASLNALLTGLYKFQNSVNKTKHYSNIAKKIALRPELVADLKELLVKPGAAEERFGESSAEARIAAIDLLVELGRQGDWSSVFEVQKTLNLSKLKSSSFDPQQEIDRQDLLRSIVEAQGPKILDNLESFLIVTGFQPALASDYDKMLWFRLKNVMGEEELREKLKY